MESPYYEMTHDLETENSIAIASYNKGSMQGVVDGQALITRCKNCIYGRTYNSPINGTMVDCEKMVPSTHKPNWFCADGKPKSNKEFL